MPSFWRSASRTSIYYSIDRCIRSGRSPGGGDGSQAAAPVRWTGVSFTDATLSPGEVVPIARWTRALFGARSLAAGSCPIRCCAVTSSRGHTFTLRSCTGGIVSSDHYGRRPARHCQAAAHLIHRSERRPGGWGTRSARETGLHATSRRGSKVIAPRISDQARD